MNIWNMGKIPVVAVLFILVVEVALRIFVGLGNPPLLTADPEIGYYLNPNQNIKRFGNRIYYNAQGLRSGPINEYPSEGVTRIIAVGDSVLNGGVLTDQQDTPAYQLERKLKDAGVNVQVIAATAGNWAPQNEYAFLKSRGVFHSHIALLEIGIHDICQPKPESSLVGTPWFPNQRPFSAIWELGYRYAWHSFLFPLPAPIDDYICPPAQKAECLTAIAGMIDLTRASGAAPLILLTPNRNEIEGRRNEVDLRNGLLALALAKNVPLEDTLPAYKELLAKEGILPMRDYVHPDERGNALMADVAADLIMRHLRLNNSSTPQSSQNGIDFRDAVGQ